MDPSPNGEIGRSADGRFGVGNPGGPGNPHSAQVARLRSALLDAVTSDDVKDIVKKLVELAKSGNLTAAKLLLDRACGKPSVDHLPPMPKRIGTNRRRVLEAAARLQDASASVAAEPNENLAEKRQQIINGLLRIADRLDSAQ